MHTEVTERLPRKKPTHEVDLTVPLKVEEIMKEDVKKHGPSCFGLLWAPSTKACSICSDKDVCGIEYHSLKLKPLVKAVEEKSDMLDMSDFEGIDPNTLLIWVKTSPRTFSQLVKKVQALSNCPDEETVKYWAKSFIADNPRLTVVEGVVKLK